MSMPIFKPVTAFCAVWSIVVVAFSAQAGDWDITGVVDIEGRVFTSKAAYPRQNNAVVSPSVSIKPQIIYEWNRQNDRFSFKPFVRWDHQDSQRSHMDIREASWLHLANTWDSVIGVDKVFWGVTESRHLVDIINQTDAVENTNGETKLGQPMANLNIERDWGTLSAFVLPGFRKRTFADSKGRFSGSKTIDRSKATFESSAKERHVDVALRWRQTYGDLDVGVSHFRGTSRAPRMIETTKNGETILTPHYDLIDQTSVDAQVTRGATLWKFEGLTRTGQGGRITAAVGGLEHTLYGLQGTSMDLGVLLEYQYDDRNAALAPPTSGDNDVFLGARLTLNNEQDTAFLAGALVDRKTGSTMLSVEADHRLNDRFKLSLEARVLTNIDAKDAAFESRADDVLIVRLGTYF